MGPDFSRGWPTHPVRLDLFVCIYCESYLLLLTVGTSLFNNKYHKYLESYTIIN